MTRTRAFLAVVTLFLLGVLIGVLATHAFYAWRLGRPGGMADLAFTVLAADVRRSLDLDQSQEAELGAILADARVEMTEVREEVLRRIQESRVESFTRLWKILRPEQRVELEALWARQSERLGRLTGQPVPTDPPRPAPPSDPSAAAGEELPKP